MSMNDEQKKEYVSMLLSRMVNLTTPGIFQCTGCGHEGTSLDPMKLPHSSDCHAYATMKLLHDHPKLLDRIDWNKYLGK